MRQLQVSFGLAPKTGAFFGRVVRMELASVSFSAAERPLLRRWNRNRHTVEFVGFLARASATRTATQPPRAPLAQHRGAERPDATGRSKRACGTVTPRAQVLPICLRLRGNGGRRAFYAIEKFGAPERSRTPNPQIRSLVLYPVELRAPAEQRSGCGPPQLPQPHAPRQGGSSMTESGHKIGS